jgi:hypothetical protein
MKRLFVLLFAALCSLAHAVAPGDFIGQQINVDGYTTTARVIAQPAGGGDGVWFFTGATKVNYFLKLSSQFSVVGGELTVSGAPFNYGLPVARSIAVSTSYQASTPTKATDVTVSPTCSATLSLAVGQTCALEARVSSSTATCSTGTVVATWTNENSGSLTIGLGLTQRIGAPGIIKLPIGAYFILCPLSGTFTITTAVDQTAG